MDRPPLDGPRLDCWKNPSGGAVVPPLPGHGTTDAGRRAPSLLEEPGLGARRGSRVDVAPWPTWAHVSPRLTRWKNPGAGDGLPSRLVHSHIGLPIDAQKPGLRVGWWSAG